ncbi:MAG: SDR family oxidoreductase [Pseudomonadota bacterium]
MESRTLLVSGTSRGLGQALAEHYLALGHSVIGCSRSEASISHPAYQHYAIDVSNEEQVTGLVRALRREGPGKLDAVINNAGIAAMNAFALSPISSFDRIFDVNVRGTALFCQKTLPLLRKATHPRIVNFTTIAVPMRLNGEAFYAASKSAVETLTRIIAREYGSYGITCNAVGPSPIDTALIAGVPADKIDRLLSQQAIKEKATADDVINAVDFFLRPESRHITGQILYLGGYG